MTIIDYILSNREQIDMLTRNGLMSTSITNYADMYLQMRAKIKARIPYTVAAKETADQFGVSERTVYSAKQMMEKKAV